MQVCECIVLLANVISQCVCLYCTYVRICLIYMGVGEVDIVIMYVLYLDRTTTALSLYVHQYT